MDARHPRPQRLPRDPGRPWEAQSLAGFIFWMRNLWFICPGIVVPQLLSVLCLALLSFLFISKFLLAYSTVWRVSL
jgi:hypothetical protein